MKTINHTFLDDNYLTKVNDIVVRQYKNEYGLSCDGLFKIIVSDSIFEEIFNLAESMEEKASYQRRKNIIEKFSGACFFPTESNKNFYIIIHSSRYKDDRSCVYERTLFHELTHLVDFYHFMSKNNIVDLRWCDDFDLLNFCSEIRAVYRSNVFYYRNVDIKKLGGMIKR